MITQALLNCALTAVLGEAATTVLKIIGITQNADSFIEAVKSGDPERIIVESLRLAVSVYALKSQCFTGDTLVSTADGDRRIDEIEARDYVWSYDTELDEKVFARVTNVSETETDVLVHVITSEGDDIRTTMFHPFYVKSIVEENGSRYNGEWKAALNLIAGDELLADDGRVIYVEEVRIERLTESLIVYNLEIEGIHTYYVGGGLLVHNGCGTNTGKSKPDKTSTPDSIYEQLNPDGTVKSRAFYDQNGNQFYRQDFDHPHFDKKTQQYYQPHEHNYYYNDKGQPIGKSDGPLSPGYDNSPTK